MGGPLQAALKQELHARDLVGLERGKMGGETLEGQCGQAETVQGLEKLTWGVDMWRREGAR